MSSLAEWYKARVDNLICSIAGLIPTIVEENRVVLVKS